MRKSVQWIIAIGALILAAVLGTLLVRHQMAVQQRDAELAQMLDEAKPKELELERIRRDLTARERALEEQTRTACICVGYQISERADIELAVRQAEQFSFTPVFVLDPTQESWRDLLDALRETPGELVLSVSPCTAEGVAAEELRAAWSETESAVADTGCFLLRNSDDSPEQLDLIAQSGYIGCIRHADAGDNIVLENGLVTLSYSQIKSGEFSLEKRLDACLENGQALLVVFELDALRTGALTEADIEQSLQQISSVWSDNALTPGTVLGSLDQVRAWVGTQAMTREQFEAYRAEQEQRIEALQAELDAIYAQWNKGDTP